MSHRVQLLSPAGSLEKLKIAIDFGADAVYGGVSHFSLRNRAGKVFDLESFKEGVDYVHTKGKKIFATINGFPFNHQIGLLAKHIQQIASLGVDAFIIAAPGVVKLAKELAPHIPIHLSTQANVLNILDAQVFYEMGVKRIVCAREMSLKDAIEVKKHLPDLELEIFVHGSMCFAFSGRCLISSLQNGRVPNRGSCANDCRFDYEYFVEDKDNGKLIPLTDELYIKAPDNPVMMKVKEEEGLGSHILNSRDLNLSGHITEILDSGAISALKIEGRTKSHYYAGISTRTYRLAIDDYYLGLSRPSLYDFELSSLKNRGFSDGYIVKRPFERLDMQNHSTAISKGDFEVCGEVVEGGDAFMCKFTVRPGSEMEILAPLNWDIAPVDNSIGSISVKEEDGVKRYFLILKRILLQDGSSLEVIHSGNTSAVLLPVKLPSYTFLRIRVA